MRFASTLENMGVSFINAIMTLIAFLPVLVTLSAHAVSYTHLDVYKRQVLEDPESVYIVH